VTLTHEHDLLGVARHCSGQFITCTPEVHATMRTLYSSHTSTVLISTVPDTVHFVAKDLDIIFYFENTNESTEAKEQWCRSISMDVTRTPEPEPRVHVQ
jgi:hypothetical protein